MSTDLSNLIERRAWDDLAGDPTNAKAMKRLAREKKRRGDLERLIGPDGKLVYRDPPATGALSIDEHGILRFGEASRSETSLADRVDAAAACADPGASDAQKKAGNYQCGHVTLQGLDITIETAKGQKRKPEWKPLSNHYGYIKRTRSEADGDHVDVFLGDCPQSEIVFIVDQVNQRGVFDEHKCMIGFTCAAEAKAAYLSNYDAGWTGFGGMKSLTMAQFKDWLDKGDTGSRAVPQRVNFMIDANGMMHKDAGSSDGGQFTSGGGGSGTKASKGKAKKGSSDRKEKEAFLLNEGFEQSDLDVMDDKELHANWRTRQPIEEPQTSAPNASASKSAPTVEDIAAHIRAQGGIHIGDLFDAFPHVDKAVLSELVMDVWNSNRDEFEVGALSRWHTEEWSEEEWNALPTAFGDDTYGHAARIGNLMLKSATRAQQSAVSNARGEMVPIKDDRMHEGEDLVFKRKEKREPFKMASASHHPVNYLDDDAEMLDRAWRLMQEDRLDFMIDENGMMHKDAGSPDGGQFTGKGGGASSTPAKAKHGDRAKALHAQHQQWKQARIDTFKEIKKDAEAAHQEAAKHTKKISAAQMEIAYVGEEEEEPFAELDQAIQNYDDGDSPAARFEALKEIERHAKAALKVEQPVNPDYDAQKKESEAKAKDLRAQIEGHETEFNALKEQYLKVRHDDKLGEEFRQKHGPRGDELGTMLNTLRKQLTDAEYPELGYSAQDVADNKQRLQTIIDSARAAREQLKLHVAHRKEMLAIKRGESPD